MIGAIVETLAPALLARNSIGRESAAQLLLTAGDNVERLRSKASFAALCGVSPVPASSGKVTRHRLNRGGNRAPNSALHIIVIGPPNRPAHQGLRATAYRRGPFQARGNSLPQTLHRTRGLQPH
jgi:transposase